MSDPLSLVPFALAAANGSVNDVPCRQLVAAGITLLQRCAPLVQALRAGRVAVVMPASAELLVALAASTGHGALLVDPYRFDDSLDVLFGDAHVDALFTTSQWIDRIPPGMPHVLLDAAPLSAQVVVGAEQRNVDLGAHFGLMLEGDRDAVGLDTEWVVSAERSCADSWLLQPWSHRAVLTQARSATVASTASPAPGSTAHIAHLIETYVKPLLSGAHIRTSERRPA